MNQMVKLFLVFLSLVFEHEETVCRRHQVCCQSSPHITQAITFFKKSSNDEASKSAARDAGERFLDRAGSPRFSPNSLHPNQRQCLPSSCSEGLEFLRNPTLECVGLEFCLATYIFKFAARRVPEGKEFLLPHAAPPLPVYSTAFFFLLIPN